MKLITRILCLGLLLTAILPAHGSRPLPADLDTKMKGWMEAGLIPGMALAVVQRGKVPELRTYGVVEAGSERKVSGETLFELASCSKSFTAIALHNLQVEEKISLDDPASKYLPGFHGLWQGKQVEITLNQLLAHTSGIPWESIDLIPAGDSETSVAELVEALSGTTLESAPGTKMQYATVNYALLGAVIEQVTGQSFEAYMERWVFPMVGLDHSQVGSAEGEGMATGHKIGFGEAQAYAAPVYRSNYPSGYVLSSAQDLGRYLHLQLSEVGLIKDTHATQGLIAQGKDKVVYTNGWEYLPERQWYYHDGQNPGFTSWMGFSLKDKVGIALLANSSSSYTAEIGPHLLGQLCGDPETTLSPPNFPLDSLFSKLVWAEGLLMACALLLLLLARRKAFRKPSLKNWNWSRRIGFGLFFAGTTFALMVFALLPELVSGLSWPTALVWSPTSFRTFAVLAVPAILLPFFTLSYLFLLPRNPQAQ